MLSDRRGPIPSQIAQPNKIIAKHRRRTLLLYNRVVLISFYYSLYYHIANVGALMVQNIYACTVGTIIKIKYKSYTLYNIIRATTVLYIIESLDIWATRCCTGESASSTVANCRYCGNIVNSYSCVYAVCIYYGKQI